MTIIGLKIKKKFFFVRLRVREAIFPHTVTTSQQVQGDLIEKGKNSLFLQNLRPILPEQNVEMPVDAPASPGAFTVSRISPLGL